MQLSQKQKASPQFFMHFQNLHGICNLFKRKMTLIADVFPKLHTPKEMVRYMSKQSRFRGPFERQHGKRAQTLLQSERQHPYHI